MEDTVQDWRKKLSGPKGLSEAELRFKAIYEQNMVKAMEQESMAPIQGCFDLWKASASYPKPEDASEEMLVTLYGRFLKRIGAVSA